MSVHAFNLGDEATRYIAGVPKGHKSKVVNRAIMYYKDNLNWIERHDMWEEQVPKLQAIITEMGTELGDLRAKMGLDDPSPPPQKGKKLLNRLAHSLNLLKDRLRR